MSFCIDLDVTFVGHILISVTSSTLVCIVWNFNKILEILHKHHCVLAYLSGHTHHGAYSRDKMGIHHVVFPSVIEAAPISSAEHATVLLYPNRVVIKAPEDSDMFDVIMDVNRGGVL